MTVRLAALTLVLVGFAAQPAEAVTATPRVECRASNPTCWPAAFASTPGGNVFFVERFTGQIRVAKPDTGSQRLWKRLGNVATSGEQGVLGIALHPRWGEARKFNWVYVYYTHQAADENRIIRIRRRTDGTFLQRVLVDIPAADTHNGGVIHFGPDGKLYAVTGDAQDPALSQDTGSRAGKILRMTTRGDAPSSGPFPGSRVFSTGHRNSFGFTWDPQTDMLWQTENGPSCDDEINRVPGGGNYGWGPSSVCPNTTESGPNPILPEIAFNPVIAPTGAAFCDGCQLDLEGQLIYGAWDTEERRIDAALLDEERDDIVSTSTVYQHDTGVLAVERRPGGRIWFSDDSAIYRLDP